MEISEPLCLICVLATLTLLVSSTSTSVPETSLTATPDPTCFNPVINNQIFTNKDSPVLVSRSGPRDCAEVQSAGHTQSGRYTVYPDDGGDPFSVYCDMDTSGGGWTVFQRRENGIVDFYRTWSEYEKGFGLVVGEHWLGNEKIHRLTSQKRYTLRVDLWDWADNTAYAEYDLFIVLGEDSDYQLSLGEYQGNAGDSLTHHNGHAFTTLDADHDNHTAVNCAAHYRGAWWYNKCYGSNLNAIYKEGGSYDARTGTEWPAWKGVRYSMKKTEMKIRAM